MKISRPYIEMLARRSSSTRSSGGDMSDLEGYASQMWTEENYVSKVFWDEVFEVRGTKTTTIGSGTPTVEDYIFGPNEVPSIITTTDDQDVTTTIETVVTDIKIKPSAWTPGSLSALGLSNSGSGGALTIEDLLDVNIANPLNGQALVYDSAQQKWVNGAVSGTVSSITAGTGLSGGTITSSGTIAINSTFQNYISHGETAYNWGNHANAGYATKTWVQQQGYVTSSGVTSVGMTVPTGFSVSPATITSSGTFSISFGGSVTANRVLASPNGSAGEPSWRALVAADIPSLDAGKITSGTFATARIPDLAASKITSGTFDKARIPDNFMVKETHDTSANIDTLYDAGSHRFAATASGTWPTGVTANYGQMLIVRGSGDTAAQMFFPYGESRVYLRNGNPISSTGSWKAWVTLATTGDTVAAANQLKDENGNAYNCTLFGQQYMINGRPQSLGYDTSHRAWLGYVSGISMAGSIDGATKIELIPSSTSATNGGFIDFHYAASTLDWTSRIIEAANGILSIRAYNGSNMAAALKIGDNVAGENYLQVGPTTSSTANASYVQIGNIRLTYDSANNALKVSTAGGGAANLYALGGVSALGFMNTGSSTLTIGSLNVNTSLFLAEGARLYTDGDFYIGDIDNGGYVCVADLCSYEGADKWEISTAGFATFKRVYLTSGCYLYMDSSSDLKLHRNGILYKLSKVAL